LGVLLGGLSSLLYGVGDFLGGEGAKRVSAATVVLWAGIVSFPLIVVVATLVGGEVGSVDLWLGAAGGSWGAIGLVSLFAGLGRGLVPHGQADLRAQRQAVELARQEALHRITLTGSPAPRAAANAS